MPLDPEARSLWAPQAWLEGRWQSGVCMQWDAQGHWSRIEAGHAAPPPGAQALQGPALPGLVNAHSHGFQRAFAGLAERRQAQHDDFWSWREQMYRVAGGISPAQLQAVALGLYRELLRGGYTQVCEFHYLHHQADGQPYDDPLAMARALVAAAAEAGIGITLLPVLYERAGFAAPQLRPEQARFATSAPVVLAMQQAIQTWSAQAASSSLVNAGVAIHSLRAAKPESIAQLVAGLRGQAVPIHIHVAEQMAEVNDSLAATGKRPIEWLAAHCALDARWHLVHATHSTSAEIAAVARAGASVVLCPSTEANLGDGLCDLPGWLNAGVPLSIGSDSHVGRDWPQELRLLEYGQRLALRQRNVAADPNRYAGSSAARLFEAARAAGGCAAGFAQWGFEVGARADVLVLDVAHSSQQDVPHDKRLDALVFSGPSQAFAGVMVAGQWVQQA